MSIPHTPQTMITMATKMKTELKDARDLQTIMTRVGLAHRILTLGLSFPSMSLSSTAKKRDNQGE